MRVTKLPFEKVGSFSSLFLDYVNGKESLKPFYRFEPDLNGFEQIIKERKFPQRNREVLVEALRRQYYDLPKSELLQKNIDLLKEENTFTVTTGHQLNLFTGPLYFIYKILTVINTCDRLKKAFPDYHFVPLYWMASEDHDFEEINHFHWGEKTYRWESNQKGPVGQMALSGFEDFLDSLPEKVSVFEKAYRESKTLAAACQCYVNALFGDLGLIALDPDNKSLKNLFRSVIKEEVIEQEAKNLVEKTNKELLGIGYSSQAFAREINFFYIDDQSRDRLIQKEDEFCVQNSEIAFSKDEILDEIQNYPESFSPNVIMRPLYQETILPNIGYAGGPTEIAYWLQLKSVFEHHDINFPILIPRNFALTITRDVERKIEKLGLTDSDLFQKERDIKNKQLLQYDDNHLLTKEKKEFEAFYRSIQEKAGNLDRSLNAHVAAESTRIMKRLEHLERKLRKAAERKNDTAMNRIESVKKVLFPKNGLQERHDNFLNYYLPNPDFLEQARNSLDPFDHQFHILWQD